MDELINISQNMKNGIPCKKLDHLLEMDVDKLRTLAATI